MKGISLFQVALLYSHCIPLSMSLPLFTWTITYLVNGIGYSVSCYRWLHTDRQMRKEDISESSFQYFSFFKLHFISLTDFLSSLSALLIS